MIVLLVVLVTLCNVVESYNGGTPRVMEKNLCILSTGGAIRCYGDYQGGCADYYGYSGNTDTAELDTDVAGVFATQGGCALLKTDGSVYTQGRSGYGGDLNYPSNMYMTCSSPTNQMNDQDLSSGVIQVITNENAMAALKANGQVVAWGDTNDGGCIGHNYDALDVILYETGIEKIYSTLKGGMAAINTDGRVLPWGGYVYGGSFSYHSYTAGFDPAANLGTGASEIFSTAGAFAALKTDGKVFAW